MSSWSTVRPPGRRRSTARCWRSAGRSRVARGLAAPIEACWIAPPEGTRISRPVRELTGLERSVPLAGGAPAAGLVADARGRPAARGGLPAPCVIHFARFELGFLRGPAPAARRGGFPLDTVCLHEMARRLFPELPRRNLRALAGYLGHSPELMRRSAGHVDASAFIWRALLPALEAAAVSTWDDLKAWLDRKAPPRARRTYPAGARAAAGAARSSGRLPPAAPERRRPVRGQGGQPEEARRQPLYPGRARPTERALEMLTQVHSVEVTPAETVLEAALLETDEIKRLHPPYNVQLREDDRRVWFARADLTDAAPAPDGVHRVGPLPSRWALASLAAVRALASGGEACPTCAPGRRRWACRPVCARRGALRARVGRLSRRAPRAPARGTPGTPCCAPRGGSRSPAWPTPTTAMRTTPADVLGPRSRPAPPRSGAAARGAARAARALAGPALRRQRGLPRAGRERLPPAGDRPRSDRRARRPRRPRAPSPDAAACRPWHLRQAAIDAAGYDRLRVLATELARVRAEGGSVRGAHRRPPDRRARGRDPGRVSPALRGQIEREVECKIDRLTAKFLNRR